MPFPEMLDRALWLNYIKTSLGYPVVNVYMTDDMIEQQISFSIRKVLPWVNAVEFIEVGRKTEFKDRLVYAVLRVHKPGYVETTSSVGASYYDMLIARSIYNQMGGTKNAYLGSSTSGMVNAALYNYQYEETLATMNPIGFRLIGNVLYVDDASGSEGPYTAECVTNRSLYNMTEDYQSWILRHSLAICKQCEGRILRKIKVSGSPVEQDGESLMNEGITEQKELEEKLGSQMSLFFCTR